MHLCTHRKFCAGRVKSVPRCQSCFVARSSARCCSDIQPFVPRTRGHDAPEPAQYRHQFMGISGLLHFRRCRETKPRSVQVGLMSILTYGGRGEARNTCDACDSERSPLSKPLSQPLTRTQIGKEPQSRAFKRASVRVATREPWAAHSSQSSLQRLYSNS